MDTFKVYLSGAMSGQSLEEQSKWRKQIKNAILYGEYGLSVKPTFFDPTDFYGFDNKVHLTEREPFEFDLFKLRKSDLVIVNFNDGGKSIGTAMELALAYEHRIPVVGLNKDNKSELHPWLEEVCSRMCYDMRELVDYVVEFYMV